MKRLAIETSAIEESTVAAVRLVGGEVVIPPGRTMNVTSPVAGVVRAAAGSLPAPGAAVHKGDAIMRLIPLAPIDRDLRARGQREVTVANTQLTAAEARVARIGQLSVERAASQRTYEEALAARDVAAADLKAARARADYSEGVQLVLDAALTVRAPDDGIVRALAVVAGQAVAAGVPLVDIVAAGALQVRVPTYAGDLAKLDREAPARVRALGAAVGDSVSAAPVAGPPTADLGSVTIDRYFALGPGAMLVPGERVLVELALRSEANARTAPWSAVVYDASGAAWVYTCVGERVFRRERIDPMRRAGEQVVFVRGPAPGTCVASVGASEIFGSEFEPGH